MPKMRGTELIARMMTEMKLAAKRSGREVSQENLDQLAAIHRKLKQGHDTMDEAMRELAHFVAEKDPGDGTDDPPASGEGYVDNLKAADAGTGVTGAGIDTADARSITARRGATRPELYRTGNAPVRGGSRARRPR